MRKSMFAEAVREHIHASQAQIAAHGAIAV
jgi:hypothetical protein